MSKLTEVIKKGESKILEFKSDLPVGTGLAKSAVAFSNMAGGMIPIGVEDGTGTVAGLTDEQIFNYPDRIADILFDSCHPAIIPDIFTECVNGKMVLGIRIHPGPLKPYYLKTRGEASGTYIRVGATNKPADGEMIRELAISDRAVKKQIKLLKDGGRLKRVGPDRGGYWQITE